MRHLTLISVLVAGLGTTAFAQGAPETVAFKLSVNQPSLFDTAKRDTFVGSVDDRTGITRFTVECSAGSSALFGLSRTDEACSVSGDTTIRNPANPSQTLPRINYMGGFTIEAKQDGYVDASTIVANYLRVGSVPAETAAFGGSLVMMPESPSASARALGDALIKRLQEKATGTEQVEFSNEIDSVRFEGFTVPHVGQKDSTSCSWTGDAIYAYANDAWQMAFSVNCGGETVKLEGSMPLIDGPEGGDWQDGYQVNLVVPGAGGGDPFAEPDPFATVDGLTGTIKHYSSGRKNDDGVYEKVEAVGELVGTGVPLELVRSFGQIVILLGRTFEGA